MPTVWRIVCRPVCNSLHWRCTGAAVARLAGHCDLLGKFQAGVSRDRGYTVPMITAAIDWTDIPVERVSDDVSRRVVQGDGFTLIRYVYDPGAVFSEHAHLNEQLTMVESGTLVLTVGGEEIAVGPGQMIRVPPSIPHGARVQGSTQVVSLNFFVPARSEHPTG